IAATNRDPKAAVQAHTFRSDLLYRLAVFPVRVPALRERKSDIPYLAHRFLNELNEQEGTKKVFAPDALFQLESYHWPGNIRELKNTVTRAFILADDEVEIPQLSANVQPRLPDVKHGLLKISVGTPLDSAQRAVIMATLDYYGGDKRRTAMALGISPKTLYNRLEEFRKQGYMFKVA